jgi:hypothetical protein
MAASAPTRVCSAQAVESGANGDGDDVAVCPQPACPRAAMVRTQQQEQPQQARRRGFPSGTSNPPGRRARVPHWRGILGSFSRLLKASCISGARRSAWRRHAPAEARHGSAAGREGGDGGAGGHRFRVVSCNMAVIATKQLGASTAAGNNKGAQAEPHSGARGGRRRRRRRQSFTRGVLRRRRAGGCCVCGGVRGRLARQHTQGSWCYDTS